jgi:hypothetical protein
MAWRSMAQSPKSICWQRLEQKGRKGDCSPHSTGFLQVGQLTVMGGLLGMVLSVMD